MTDNVRNVTRRSRQFFAKVHIFIISTNNHLHRCATN